MADIEKIKGELRQADLFHEWDDVSLELVSSICQERTYDRYDIVFDENSISDELYVITEGEIEIQVNPALLGIGDDNQHKTLTIMRRGQNFGEIALLDQGRRTAAAVCRTYTELIVIPHDRIMLLCDNYPKLGYKLMRNLALDLATKIRSTDLDIREHLLWIPVSRRK